MPRLIAAHDWVYDRHGHAWHCTVCAAPHTGLGPSRTPPAAGCRGADALVDETTRWGRTQHDGGGLDELVAVSRPGAEITQVHLERMDTGAWWLRIGLADSTSITVNLHTAAGQPRTITGFVEED